MGGADGIGRREPLAEILAAGFGATVAMWALGYLARLPAVAAPSWLLGLAMLACYAGGGVAAGRYGSLGWRGGAGAGLLSALLNLLILGSFLAGEGINTLRPGAAMWVPGSLLLGAALGAVGGAIGARVRRRLARLPSFAGIFAAVAALATLLLLAAGGLVTSKGAGLAVVDWPNSFGYNMFLYPLSRMTGGIYYEHAHRLFGSLVGLTTVALALYLLRTEPRRWVRNLALAAVPLVVVQGLLGGLRVTGRFTLSTAEEAMAPSISLAVAHGVLGQLFFATLAVLAAATSTTWRSDTAPRRHECTAVDARLTWLLCLALAAQLVLGAVQRHLARGLMVHIGLAVVVTVLAVAVAARLAAAPPGTPVLRRLGGAMVAVMVTQVVLGFGALVAVLTRDGDGAARSWDVLVRTAHQATGAILLAAAVLAAAWVRRLSRAPES